MKNTDMINGGINTTGLNLVNPIMVALDVDSADDCVRLADALKGKVGAFKIGPRLNVRYGTELISRLARSAPVFVDNKYLDIPSTMEGAIRATFESGATFTTIHAWAGREALRRLAEVEKELNQKRPFKILVVTILTSFSPETLPPGMTNRSIADHVSALGDMALAEGLSGLVCSSQEVQDLRAKSSAAFLVTPGIRLPSGDPGDQKRIETPAEAMRLGSSALVIGRPIYESKDPLATVEQILETLKGTR
jgi:orotidine-5'-phosphate decarboxylase